jgi:hypothetical protein
MYPTVICRTAPPIISNCGSVVLERRKQLIEYVGTASATDFRRISLPAQLACLPLQEPTTCLTLVGKN